MRKFIDAEGAANLRAGPSKRSDINAVLPVGTAVEVEEPFDGWHPAVVTETGATGFVSTNVVRDSLGDQVDRFIQVVGRELEAFDYGDLAETDPLGMSRISSYWTSFQSHDEDPVKVPWSAAFISFAVRSANLSLPFTFSARHTTYLSAAKRAFLDDTPYAFDCVPLDHAPVRVGDMVAKYRNKQRRSYDDLPGDFASHVDIVVSVEPHLAWLVGGNLTHSVRIESVPLDQKGCVRDSGRRIALMRRRF